jgi:hypothetical protein
MWNLQQQLRTWCFVFYELISPARVIWTRCSIPWLFDGPNSRSNTVNVAATCSAAHPSASDAPDRITDHSLRPISGWLVLMSLKFSLVQCANES